jgi:hypothetical protein
MVKNIRLWFCEEQGNPPENIRAIIIPAATSAAVAAFVHAEQQGIAIEEATFNVTLEDGSDYHIHAERKEALGSRIPGFFPPRRSGGGHGLLH